MEVFKKWEKSYKDMNHMIQYTDKISSQRQKRKKIIQVATTESPWVEDTEFRLKKPSEYAKNRHIEIL